MTRKIIYDVAMTLDGFMADSEGQCGDFVPDGPHVVDYLARLETYGTVIMGRSTYEFGYQFGLKPGKRAYAHMDHYIFSDSLTFDDESEVNVVARTNLDLVRDLKASSGNPIYLCGGGVFAASLLQARLIDQLVVKMNPVLIGQGLPLFAGSDPKSKVALVLTSSKHYTNGVALLEYDLQYDHA